MLTSVDFDAHSVNRGKSPSMLCQDALSATKACALALLAKAVSKVPKRTRMTSLIANPSRRPYCPRFRSLAATGLACCRWAATQAPQAALRYRSLAACSRMNLSTVLRCGSRVDSIPLQLNWSYMFVRGVSGNYSSKPKCSKNPARSLDLGPRAAQLDQRSDKYRAIRDPFLRRSMSLVPAAIHICATASKWCSPSVGCMSPDVIRAICFRIVFK